MIPHRSSSISSSAFSLIELLIVMGILALLATIAVPAIGSIGASRGVTHACYDVSSLVDLARNEAVARQTYVWLGFQTQTNNGSIDLRLGLVYSKDGSTNTGSTNLQALTRAITVRQVGLYDVSAGSTPFGSFPEARPIPGTGLSFSIGNVQFSDRRTITFTPRGEAILISAPTPTDGFQPEIGIGLRRARGIEMPANESDSAVIVDGSVAIPRIYQAE